MRDGPTLASADGSLPTSPSYPHFVRIGLVNGLQSGSRPCNTFLGFRLPTCAISMVMVGVSVGTGTSVRIVGHGILVEEDYFLSPEITVSPTAPAVESSFGSRTVRELRNNLNIMAMEGLADFSLRIDDPRGGDALAAKAWNALWTFYLLALACRRPVIPLYSVAEMGSPRFTLANRNLVIHRLPSVATASAGELDWAREHSEAFDALLKVDRFTRAMRAYGNAHYLFDDDAKIMLLWAGIEGLLGIDAELRRRIALHAAILHDGSPEDKAAYFARIKKGYDLRSKVVHGAGAGSEALRDGYELANEVLLGLLRKVVTLGHVPEAAELDDLAACASLAGPHP